MSPLSILCRAAALVALSWLGLSTQPASAQEQPSRRVRFQLNTAPITRLRVYLDHQDSGAHKALEWDPELPGGVSLIQHVQLRPGQWQVSLISDVQHIANPTTSATSASLQLSIGQWQPEAVRWLLTVPASNASLTDMTLCGAKEAPCTLELKGSIVVSKTDSTVDTPIKSFLVHGGITRGDKGTVSESNAALGDQYVLKITPVSNPDIKELKANLVPRDAGTADGRSLDDAVPKAVVELFQVLGEIAVERARSKGFALLSERIKSIICNDLPAEIQVQLQRETARLLDLDPTALPPLPAKLLTHTCAVVSNLRLQDLQTIRKPLLAALLRDLGDLGVDAVMVPVWGSLTQTVPAAAPAFEPVMQALASSLRTLITDQTPLGARDAQRLLLALSKVDWSEKLQTSDFAALGCGLDLGFAVMASCQAKGSCDVREIASMVSHPLDYLSSQICGPIWATLDGAWPELPQLIDQGLGILSPPRGSTPRGLARDSLLLTIKLVERFFETKGKLDHELLAQLAGEQQKLAKPTPELEQMSAQALAAILDGLVSQTGKLSGRAGVKSRIEAQVAAAKSAVPAARAAAIRLLFSELSALRVPLQDAQLVGLLFSAARTFVASAVEGNVPELIVTLGGLVQNLLGRLPDGQRASVTKALQLVAAVTAYASSYSGDAKLDDAKAHEARKKAIENLIDAAANRNERNGEWVFSLGANVGASLIGGQYLAAQSSFQGSYPHLALPIGVAAQWLPQGASCRVGHHDCTRYIGFHAQLSPIDLGQFVAYDGTFQITSTRWSNFVTADVQLGMLLGKPSSPFMLGLDLRWSPTLFSQETVSSADGSATDHGGVFRFGLFFGYYVPFFDFN